MAGDDPQAQILNTSATTLTISPLHPVVPGHVLVIPKAHYPFIDTLPAELLSSLIRQVAREAGYRFPTNIIQSNGARATQTIFHVHFHIVPRDVAGLPDDWPWGFN